MSAHLGLPEEQLAPSCQTGLWSDWGSARSLIKCL